MRTHQQDDRAYSHGERGQRCVRNRSNGLHDVVEKPALVEMDSHQLGNLVEHDHQPDACLEPDEHGLGDEVGDEPEPQHGGNHQDDADEKRQRGRRADQSGGVTIRCDQREVRRNQDGQGRRGAHAERTRGPQQRVDHHREERGVET
jgi:hypothetical protein